MKHQSNSPARSIKEKKSSLPPTMALTVDTVTLEAGDEPVNEVERELLE